MRHRSRAGRPMASKVEIQHLYIYIHFETAQVSAGQSPFGFIVVAEASEGRNVRERTPTLGFFLLRLRDPTRRLSVGFAYSNTEVTVMLCYAMPFGPHERGLCSSTKTPSTLSVGVTSFIPCYILIVGHSIYIFIPFHYILLPTDSRRYHFWNNQPTTMKHAHLSPSLTAVPPAFTRALPSCSVSLSEPHDYFLLSDLKRVTSCLFVGPEDPDVSSHRWYWY